MLTVLVVDNEQDNLELQRRRLTRRGFAVLTASSGAEGLQIAAAERPAVVLMDIGMPEMDGFEATRRLKADPATAGIPVIAFTAHAFQEDKDRSLAAGASEYASKPVDMDWLAGRIHELAAAATGGL